MLLRGGVDCNPGYTPIIWQILVILWHFLHITGIGFLARYISCMNLCGLGATNGIHW